MEPTIALTSNEYDEPDDFSKSVSISIGAFVFVAILVCCSFRCRRARQRKQVLFNGECDQFFDSERNVRFNICTSAPVVVTTTQGSGMQTVYQVPISTSSAPYYQPVRPVQMPMPASDAQPYNPITLRPSQLNSAPYPTGSAPLDPNSTAHSGNPPPYYSFNGSYPPEAANANPPGYSQVMKQSADK